MIDSESNLESEEIDQEINSDSSCNSINSKAIKSNKYLDSSCGHTAVQKKGSIASDLTHKDKSASPSLEFINVNQLQKNEESSNQNVNFSKGIRDEKSSKVKSENDIQNQKSFIPELPSNDETKHNSRYSFDSETKIFRKNADKFKLEYEDDFIKHSEKDSIKFNHCTKRSTSANNSPYKEKKRKMFMEKAENNYEFSDQGTTHFDTQSLHKTTVKKIYYSYFERGCDDRDEIREIK